MTTNNPGRGAAVSAGIAAARERGARLGRPPKPVPGGAERAEALRGEGLSLAAIAAVLTEENVPTPSGKGAWTRSSVQYALARLAEHRAAGAGSSSSAAPPADPGA
jgi:hypothetical protein